MGFFRTIRAGAYLAAAFSLTCGANAATLSLKSNGDIQLEGRIEAGDLDKLRALIARAPIAAGTRKLYLNSDGGLLSEADRLIAAMWRGEGELPDSIGPIETVLPAGAKCLSSCAFVFMHGQGAQEESEYPLARSIHVSATLGFHRPYLPQSDKSELVEDIATARTEATEILNRINAYGAMTSDLIADYERKGPNEYLAVANATQAAEWEIGVFVDDPGRAPRMTLGRENAYTACTRFQDREFRPEATTYGAYTKGADLSAVRKPQSYKDRDRNIWPGAYVVKVPGGDGNDLSCAIWLPHPDDVTRVSTETDGESVDLSWLYLLPPGLALNEIPGFLLRDQAAAAEKSKPPQVVANVDNSTLLPSDKNIDVAVPVVPPVQEQRLASPYAAQVCNGAVGFANVRKGPGSKFGLVDSLPNRYGVTVTADAENADSKAPWKGIRFLSSGRELTGYIDASVLAENCSIAVIDPQPKPPVDPPETFEARAAVVCNKAASFANVRQGPAPTFSVAGKVANGGGVTLIGEAQNPQSGQPWYRITFAGGSGYIDSDYIADTCANDTAEKVEEPPPPRSEAQSGVVCNAGSVYSNVRSGPSSTFKALGRVNNHERVAVLSRAQNPASGHTWYEIQFENQGKVITGYIDSDAVGASCGLADNLGMDRQVCNAASAVSNVREGPASNRQLSDRLTNGTKVFVVKGHSSPLSGHLWFEIRYGAAGEKHGYIDADAVKSECQVAGE